MVKVIFDYQAIANNFKRYRLEENLTLKQLSILSNISIRSISNYEKGETLPRFTNLIKLANVLKVSLDDLLVYRFVNIA